MKVQTTAKSNSCSLFVYDNIGYIAKDIKLLASTYHVTMQTFNITILINYSFIRDTPRVSSEHPVIAIFNRKLINII